MYEPVYYTVGELAKTYGLPISTLRFYDKHGIFVPEYRDPNNGYRYYSSRQLLTLDLILFLREIGVSAGMIPGLLKNVSSRSELMTKLSRHKIDIEKRIAALTAVRRRLERLEEIYSTMNLSTGNVEIKDFPDRYFYCLDASSLPSDGAARRYIYKSIIAPKIANNKPVPVEMRSLGAISSLSSFRQKGDLSYTFQFQEPVEDETIENMKKLHIPAGKYLTLRFANRPGERLEACRILLQYIDDNNIQTHDMLIEAAVGVGMPPVTVDEEIFEFQVQLK
ncbi:MAG: MerR family transcriptional regulator [Oscillospiraceae bacterium]|jgi:DNA-binding transcriptional MerR regulator